MQTLKTAVIGGGIAGMASAWLLRERHEVTLFERNDYIGGHTHTVPVRTRDGEIAVDTGFIVYNERNYPLLVRLFRHLGIETRPTVMSFSASIDAGALEYAGSGLNSLFAQRTNLLRPSFLLMLKDIARFNREARYLLQRSDAATYTLGDYLSQARYGHAFRDDYLLPLAAAIWSCPTGSMLQFPLLSFLRFFANHGLTDLRGRPRWRTVSGGSHRYIEAMRQSLRGRLHTDQPALAVERAGDDWMVHTTRGPRRFRRVIFACHADEALQLMARPGARHRAILGAFRYQANRTLLHSDPALMPKRRGVWAAWNYLAQRGSDRQQNVSVTYWMNLLQGICSAETYFVSLNPLREPHPGSVIREMTYHHPVFDTRALRAQDRLRELQGVDGLWFCGSYHGYGFHEDALRSAVDVATRLGGEPPWSASGTATALPDDNRRVRAA